MAVFSLASAWDRYKRFKMEYPENFRIKVYRSLTWLSKAASLKDPGDLDLRFVALWISFNCAYACEVGPSDPQTGDHATLRNFLKTVCRFDQANDLHDFLKERVDGSLGQILASRYTLQAFWDYHNGKIGKEEWLRRYDDNRNRTQRALERGDHSDDVLNIVFNRIYTIRNQVLHGGSTCGGKTNRALLSSASDFLLGLMPRILLIMMDNYDLRDWGRPYYPVVRDGGN